MAKKKPIIIKPTPEDAMDDNSFQYNIIAHVKAFGFEHVIENIIEAYRVQARRFNKKADELEKQSHKKRGPR